MSGRTFTDEELDALVAEARRVIKYDVPIDPRKVLERAADAIAFLRADRERMTDALRSIRLHVAPQPSALAKAIVATVDATLPPAPEESK
jgi:predicted DNA-binding transcriptional regulator YafY